MGRPETQFPNSLVKVFIYNIFEFPVYHINYEMRQIHPE